MHNKLTLRLSSQFKKDFKKFRNNSKLVAFIEATIDELQNEKPLPPSYRDHMLTGNWKGYRECHIRPDCLLIYKIENQELLLARIGNHSELF